MVRAGPGSTRGSGRVGSTGGLPVAGARPGGLAPGTITRPTVGPAAERAPPAAFRRPLRRGSPGRRLPLGRVTGRRRGSGMVGVAAPWPAAPTTRTRRPGTRGSAVVGHRSQRRQARHRAAGWPRRPWPTPWSVRHRAARPPHRSTAVPSSARRPTRRLRRLGRRPLGARRTGTGPSVPPVPGRSAPAGRDRRLGSCIRLVRPGAAGAATSSAAPASTLPSATTSSGCSITTGGSPSARCSSVAISGIRLEPPTRKTPATLPSASWAQRISPSVTRTVCSSSGSASASSSSRVRCTSRSSSGTIRSARWARDSRSLATRTSSQSWRLARRSSTVAGASSRCPGRRVALAVDRLRRWSTQRRVDVDPAEVVAPVDREHLEARRRGAPPRWRRTCRRRSRAPRRPSRSARRGRAPRRSTWSRPPARRPAGRRGRPARAAASASTVRRVAPQVAGQVRVTVGRDVADGAPPLLGHPGEHGGDQLADRHLAVAEQDGAVVDAALRVGLEPGRVEPGAVHRVAADDQRAAGLGVHGRGQQRRAVDQQRSGPPVRSADHRDGVRRAEVHAERVADRG